MKHNVTFKWKEKVMKDLTVLSSPSLFYKDEISSENTIHLSTLALQYRVKTNCKYNNTT